MVLVCTYPDSAVHAWIAICKALAEAAPGRHAPLPKRKESGGYETVIDDLDSIQVWKIIFDVTDSGVSVTAKD